VTPTENAISSNARSESSTLGIQIDVNREASVDDWLKAARFIDSQARLLVELCSSGVQFYCLEDIAVTLNIPPRTG